MNKYQSARLDSLNLIVKESSNNPESIALVPTFGTIIKQLENICTELGEHQVDQEKDLTGITTNKDVTLENLADSSIEIAGAVHSYAYDKQDHALMEKVNYRSTDIERMTQSEVVVVAGIILEEALKIPATDLANEGITAKEITDFKELISYFKSIKSSNREAVIDRSGTTEKINELFREASSLIKNKLDRLALQFKRKDPAFYLKYKAARTVLYRPAQKTDLEPQKEETE